MERYFQYGYWHNTMEVKIENLSKVLLELGSNKDVFSISVDYVAFMGDAKAYVRFGSYN